MKRRCSHSCRFLPLAVPAAAGALAAPAHAVIVYTNLNSGAGITLDASSHLGLYFSPDLQQAQTSYFTGAEFLLVFHDFDPLQPYSYPRPAAAGATAITAGDPPFSARLAGGAIIGYSRDFDVGPMPLYYLTTGPWAPGSRGYLGLGFIPSGTHPNFGWADVSYNANHTLTLYSFAYETTPTVDIAAGAVPEPAEAALAGALVAGSAAAFAARKKRRVAKAA